MAGGPSATTVQNSGRRVYRKATTFSGLIKKISEGYWMAVVDGVPSRWITAFAVEIGAFCDV
jgi:hypothetical protein